MSKKALILTWEKYQDHEVIYPYYRVQEDDFEVDIMTNILGRVHGYLGTYNESTKLVSDFDDQKKYDSYMNDYGLLIIPGGVKALEYLRQQTNALKFISEWNEKGKVIGCICHGAQLLISAKATTGKKISAYYSIEDDVNNSGATYVNAPVVIDQNIVSSPHYNWMGEWMKAAIEKVKNP